MSPSHPFPTPTLIPVNGVQLEVFEAGRENVGRPIVLCHGWPELALTWRRQIPALVAAGFHVIVPHQRGYGKSSHPSEVTAYDLTHLAGDLVALLDHYGYADATFVGHDWGAAVVWGLTLLHPERVKQVVAVSMPYLERGDVPWIAFMEAVLGADYYFVHFNRRPGVADALFDANAARFLRNLYRKNEPLPDPPSVMPLLALAESEEPLGDPLLEERELAEFVAAFEESGFTGGINWYRNLDRNWHLLSEVDPVIHQPALMVYGERDVVQRGANLRTFVPNVEEVTLDSGHWIPQEVPAELNRVMLDWLARQDA